MTTLAEIKARTVTSYYELVKIEVGDDYYVTNAPFDIVHSGNTYISAGALLSLDSIENNIDFEVPKINISVAGIIDIADGDYTPPFVQTILDIDYVDRPLTIFRSYFDQGTQIGTMEVFKGLIDNASIQYQPSGTTAVQIQASSHWITFTKKNGRRTNTPSQQVFFANDIGLDGCADVQKEIVWK